MTTAIIIFGALMGIMALSCFHGAIIRKIIEGDSMTWSTKAGLSSDCREWAALMWIALSYPFGWLNPLPKINHTGIYSRPIMLVPGYGLNRLSMLALQIRLKRRGFKWVWAVNNPIFKDDINAFSKALQRKIEWYKWRTGEDKIDIIGFSMGGLISREAQAKQPESIHRFISINTPWKGTILQHIAPGRQAKQMAENSEFTRTDQLPHGEHLALVASQDWVVLPNKNMLLPNINSTQIAHAGHMNILFSHAAFQHIYEFLRSDRSEQ